MYKILLFVLLWSHCVIARDYTKPPSIAMRNEISFVSEVLLVSKKPEKTDTKNTNQWLLNFKLLKDIHNKASNKVSFSVTSKLAKNLEHNVKYIIAYQTHRKTKVNGVIKYIPYANGAKLINVDGANPAIFRHNNLLLKQLMSLPEQAEENPQTFINNIINGMFESDPKIQEFFVRELINWIDLHATLSKQNYSQLRKIFLSPNATVGTMTAFLENRSSFHQSIGINEMKEKTINLLMSFPVELDDLSNHPKLILQAITFVETYKLGNWDLYSRWLQCNIPSITEKSLLALDQIDSKKTSELVKKRILDSNLNDSSRRVLKRYIFSSIK